MFNNKSEIISQNFDSLIKIEGFFWFAGYRNLEFRLDKTYIRDLSFIHHILPLNQGAILKVNDKFEIKKECGSRKFLIKKDNKFNYIKNSDLLFLLGGLK